MTATRIHPVLHGGRLDSACSTYGGSRRSWLDLSTCLNPYPYGLRGLSPTSWFRLPDDSDESDCRHSARRCYSVGDDAHISLAAGSQRHIQLLPSLFKPQSVAIVGFTYGEHSYCWQRCGHKVYVSDGLESAISNSRIVIVVNPNNPDGRLYSVSDLVSGLNSLRRLGGVLIVDEAFCDLSPDSSMASHVGSSHLIVLRSFSKFYGLGGVRLGFALCHRDLGERLDESLGPWSVSGPALSLGTKALSDRRWQSRARRRLSSLRVSLESILTRHGFTILGGTDLFVLVEHSRADSIAEHLLHHHILVRRFPEQPHWLRIGALKRSSLSRLDKALALASGLS